MKLLDHIEIDLRGPDSMLTVHIDVEDNSLSRKWLDALNNIIRHDLHLEKNYCFLGFPNSERTVDYLCTQMNRAVVAINNANLGYVIRDWFSPSNTIMPIGDVDHDHMNQLHRYFEDLQGVSGAMSPYYTAADDYTRWHIRQLNLLCHEYESLVLSIRKQREAPEWQRPSQLMCWLQAPRFVLEETDYELFGIETINRKLGGVYVGVNKAIGKAHWEVFNDEGRSIDELTTTTMRSQTEAAGDFDIEWANNPGAFHWQIKKLAEFQQWLIDNGFDPEDKSLTIGHPQVAQVDLKRSFGTTDYRAIWTQLESHLDVYRVQTSWGEAVYDYRWNDTDYAEQQIRKLK
jgi:hypothetical protein